MWYLHTFKMKVQNFTFFPPITYTMRHDSEKHVTDIHTIFQRTGLVASKVNNWGEGGERDFKKGKDKQGHTHGITCSNSLCITPT